MATPKKKHLIELMIENGVKWPRNAEYAVQDKQTLRVNFYRDGKPNYNPGWDSWMYDNCTYMRDDGITIQSICRNWHQTIVTREQYEQALSNTTVTAEIQAEPKHCESVVNQEPYTINQLASNYYAKAAEAECLQYEADKARKLANEALATLQKAGELIGLIVSVDTLQKCAEQYQQPVITDWHDLCVGDVIECTAYNDKRDDPWPGGWATQNIGTQQVVSKINDSNGKISIKDSQDSGYAFKFIHRP